MFLLDRIVVNGETVTRERPVCPRCHRVFSGQRRICERCREVEREALKRSNEVYEYAMALRAEYEAEKQRGVG
jgi:predicted amidophosphoribosyltransferase